MRLAKLCDIIDLFQSADPDVRLELLLDYARKLPPLPERLIEARDTGLNRVPECVTPVFLFTEADDDGRLRLYADVGADSPTVRGLMSILVNGCDNEPARSIAQLPMDLLMRLGLGQKIGTQRTLGFSGIVARLKRAAAGAAAHHEQAAAHGSRSVM